jgi:hypothetical protein
VPSSDKCNQQKFSRQQMLSESCCTANITTESDDSTSYTVREGMLWHGGGGGVLWCRIVSVMCAAHPSTCLTTAKSC